MRYSHDSSTSPLTLESSAQPSPVINLYPPGHTSLFNSAPAYPPDSGGPFYAPTSHVFPHIDPRSRLGSSTSTPGMAHALRSTTLPHPATRDLYTPATPSFRRAPAEHTPRSPSFQGTINHRGMEPSYNPKLQPTVPPLMGLTMHGVLYYSDAPNTQVKPEISGTIDKGFFLAEGEWTCYRRNYFSCICAFNLPPATHPQASLHFTPSGSTQSYQVSGWAMCISAVVSENDAHTIELVQHTPKRDKGPISPPEKTRLNPKPPQTAHHPLGHYTQTEMGIGGSSRSYEQSMYGQGLPHASLHASLPTEHTFERIQFKQATANNGKRRAAQQYYHLVVELFADVGAQGQGNDQWLKVAHRKSAKMIVRGRSPGHYQSERRASTSSGPGGSAGGMGGYTGAGSTMMGAAYGGPPNANMISGAYGAAYDTRPDHYRTHHESVPMEPILSSEESKAVHEPEKYQYYPQAIIEPQHDPRQPVEMFHHAPSTRPSDNPLRMGSGFDLTSKLYPGPLFSDRAGACGRYEGKPTSHGYYPQMMPPPQTSAVGLH